VIVTYRNHGDYNGSDFTIRIRDFSFFKVTQSRPQDHLVSTTTRRQGLDINWTQIKKILEADIMSRASSFDSGSSVGAQPKPHSISSITPQPSSRDLPNGELKQFVPLQ